MVVDNHLTNKYEKALSIPGVTLCALLLTLLGYLPGLPSSTSQFLRPAMIAICFVIPAQGYYRFSMTDKALTAYLTYFLFVFLSHPITKSSALAYGAVFLFGVFFIVLSNRVWTKREIQLFMFSAAIACTYFAVNLYIANPDMLHNHPYDGFTIYGHRVNDNTAAFEITPGLLCSLALFLFHKPRNEKKRFQNAVVRTALLVSAVFCMYVMFCIGARSAFLSAIVGTILICWQKTKHYRSKWTARIIIVILLIVFIVVGTIATEGTHSARLFDFKNMDDTNGRDELAEQAWPMIHKKPIFGGGYDYWEQEGGSELGTHNTFLTILVEGGYTGGLFLVLFLVSFIMELLSTRNLLLISFSVEAVFHTLTESDLDYFAYIPLLIAFVLLRYSQSRKCLAEKAL